MQEAKEIGDDFLALEKYVNLNYLVSLTPVLHAPFTCRVPSDSTHTMLDMISNSTQVPAGSAGSS